MKLKYAVNLGVELDVSLNFLNKNLLPSPNNSILNS